MGMFFSAKCPQCWERVDDCTCGQYGRRKSCEGGYSAPAPVVHVHNHIKVVNSPKIVVDKNNRRKK